MDKIEDLIKQMEDDSEGATKGSPIEVAKILGIKHPQKIYQWLRTGKLKWSTCDCGRRVVVIEEVRQLLESQSKTPQEVAGSNLDPEE